MKELSYGDIVEVKDHNDDVYKTGIITDRAPARSSVYKHQFAVTFKDGTFSSWYTPDLIDVISFSEFRVE